MASATVAPTTRAGRRVPALLGGRIVEQAVLGGASLLLAARLGTVGFAPIAALFVVNSAAVTLSDYGVGLAVLRLAPGEHVATRALNLMRAVNALLVVLGIGVGILIGGDVGIVVATSTLIWWTSAEAFVRKAGAINSGFGQRAALAEVAGATLFGIVVVVFGNGAAAVAALGVAFPLKHAAEAVVARVPARLFAPEGTTPDLGMLWGTQALNFGVANVDYLVVAATLGAAAFSVYTVAYRLAVAIPSMVAYVAGRAAVADLSAAIAAEGRQKRYGEYVGRLFVVGAVAALVIAASAFTIPAVLGGDWKEVGPSVAVLALAVPWRMVFGQAGALALSVRRADYVVRWQAVQLGAFALAFGIAGALGYGAFVVTVALSWIVSVTLFERGAARAAGIGGWVVMRRLAVIGAVITLLVGIGLNP